MAQFAGLMPRLDPYARTFNAERAARVSMPRRTLRGDGRTTGLSLLVLHKDRPELLKRLWLGFDKLREVCDRAGLEIELLLGDTGSTNPETLLKSASLMQPPLHTRLFEIHLNDMHLLPYCYRIL